MVMLEDGLVRRSDYYENSITKVAVRRIHCKPEQQGAE